MTMNFRLALLLLLAATSTFAGPCLTCDFGTGQVPLGFWNDRALSAPGRVAIAPSVDAGQDPTAIAVAWEERTGSEGDIMLATCAYDEHSQNTYLFRNCFTAADVAP